MKTTFGGGASRSADHQESSLHAGSPPLAVPTSPSDRDGLGVLARKIAGFGEPVSAAIESMNGARYIHDTLEPLGWDVEIADAQKVKGLAPLACKTDRIDAWVLAELSRRELVPAIFIPDPAVRADRERARYRPHLVRHRTELLGRRSSARSSLSDQRLGQSTVRVTGGNASWRPFSID